MTVSYLLTLYNKEDYVGGVVDSVLAEHAVTGGEIIVYDDRSTDRSFEIVRERAAANPGKIKIIRGKQNCGVSIATNRVIEAAAQPYIRLIDADDLLVPGSTNHLLRLMKENNLDFICGRTQSRAKDLGGQDYKECFIMDDPISVVLRHLTATPSSSFFAADKLKKVTPLPGWVKRTQDFSIFLRLACSGVTMGRITEIVALQPPVFTANNLSSGSAAAYAEQCRTVANDQNIIPLPYMRNVSRRYAGRALKYFGNEGEGSLSLLEKTRLWFWRHFTRMASSDACVARLQKTAAIFDRDRHVIRGTRTL